jgi:hypothetical protein
MMDTDKICERGGDMARPVSKIVAAIQDFQPSNGNWQGLDALLQELFQSKSASRGIDAMLHVFERYPTDEDGFGVFWTVLHGLESLPRYESKLVASVKRAPSDFGLLMVNRLLNAGRKAVGGVRLISLLEQVIKNQNVPPKIRREAQQFLELHRE